MGTIFNIQERSNYFQTADHNVPGFSLLKNVMIARWYRAK